MNVHLATERLNVERGPLPGGLRRNARGRRSLRTRTGQAFETDINGRRHGRLKKFTTIARSTSRRAHGCGLQEGPSSERAWQGPVWSGTDLVVSGAEPSVALYKARLFLRAQRVCPLLT